MHNNSHFLLTSLQFITFVWRLKLKFNTAVTPICKIFHFYQIFGHTVHMEEPSDTYAGEAEQNHAGNDSWF